MLEPFRLRYSEAVALSAVAQPVAEEALQALQG
jgi:hypothetical protein